MITPEVYEEFRTDVLSVINNQEIFTLAKIKVFIKQMAAGKSWFQGKELSPELYKVFCNQKFNIRVAPKNETCNDGIFEKETVVDGKKYKYRDITHIKDSLMMDEFLSDCFDTDNIYIFSITHAKFGIYFECFLRYALCTVLWIEEVHECLAVGDPGSTAYQYGTGYNTPFDAKVALRFREWMKINGRVLAFTATPTLHQQEYDEYIIDGGIKTDQKFSDLFYKCNELTNLDSLIPNQAWVDKTIRYNLVYRKTQECVDPHVGTMIDSLLNRESELEEQKKVDPNVQSKLTSLIRCGQGGGAWGCPIHKGPFGGSGERDPIEHDIGMVQIVGKHLQQRGFDCNSRMIATLQESGSGGNRIWNLNGEVVEQKLSWEAVKNRLNDNDDLLRHLIVVNRGGSGINVYNIGAIFIASVRDALWSREHIPCQVLGRGVRCNWGYGNIGRKYNNDLRNFIPVKQLEGNIETTVEVIKTANKLDIWYPRGLTDRGSKTKVDVWEDSVTIFRRDYCNSIQDGYSWLHDQTGTKPSMIESALPLPGKLLCPHCGNPVYYSGDKTGDGTLLPFFE